MKKVGKTTRPFRYELKQIPYDYTVTNRFKELDLIESLKNYGQGFMTVQEAVIKTIPKKRNVKRPNACLRRPYKYLRKEDKLKAKKKTNDVPI